MDTTDKTWLEQQLNSSSPFKYFPQEAIEQIVEATSLRQFRKSTHIISMGEDSSSAYVVASGDAYAFVGDGKGGEFVMSTLKKGDCFGELGPFGHRPRTANVATSMGCECAVIPKSVLIDMTMSYPDAAMAVIQHLVDRVEMITEEAKCLALKNVYGRLCRVIENSAEEQENGTRITPRLTHADLALRVGASREMVTRIIKDLRLGSYIIDLKGHKIQLLKNLPPNW